MRIYARVCIIGFDSDSRKNVGNMIDIGKKENFYETQEKWEIYVQRVEQFFLANNIEEDPQVPTLLS